MNAQTLKTPAVVLAVWGGYKYAPKVGVNPIVGALVGWIAADFIFDALRG